MASKRIIFYGTKWCADCRRSKEVLDRLGCEYDYIDLEEHPEAVEKVIEINNGYQSIPTIIFPDNTILVEPSNLELTRVLGELEDKKLIICHKQMNQPQ